MIKQGRVAFGRMDEAQGRAPSPLTGSSHEPPASVRSPFVAFDTGPKGRPAPLRAGSIGPAAGDLNDDGPTPRLSGFSLRRARSGDALVSRRRGVARLGLREARPASGREDSRRDQGVARRPLSRRHDHVARPARMVVRHRASRRGRRRHAVAVPLLLRAAGGGRDGRLAARRPEGARQVRPDALRRLGRRIRRHVRRGLAPLRAQARHRCGQDQGPLAPDRMELLPQALRARHLRHLGARRLSTRDPPGVPRLEVAAIWSCEGRATSSARATS